MVYRSRRACEGCWPAPSPAFSTGNRRDLGSAPARPAFEMAQHDDVGIPCDDPDRVLQGFTLGRGGEPAGGLGSQNLASQAPHRRLEREPRARARLVEQGGHYAPGQDVRPVVLDDVFHLASDAEDLTHELAVELLGFDNVVQSGHPGSGGLSRTAGPVRGPLLLSGHKKTDLRKVCFAETRGAGDPDPVGGGA